MKRVAVLVGTLTVLSASPAWPQDAMQYGVEHLKVLAEDSKVRVLKYTPRAGDKTPMHSHPSTVLYVIKGGKVKITKPEGTAAVGELKTGEALLRAPVTHADEALDDLEVVLIEIKN